MRKAEEFEAKRELCVAEFDAADKSNTGKLSKEELRDLVGKVLGRSPEQLSSTKGQAALDFVMHCLAGDEPGAGIPKGRVADVVPRFYWFMQNSEDALTAFDKFDISEPKGSLTREELKQVLDYTERQHGDPIYAVKAEEEDLDLVFKNMDWDKTGRIKRHEAVGAIAMWLEVVKDRPGEINVPGSGCCVVC